MEDLDNPIDDPYQPTVTEELLQIIEEFADYIDKFMFEIVTFLAVIDSSMGLIKDVLGMFGFAGWKMAFFPSFSFAVTMGVFLFGSNKRKGKRKAEAAQLEGLGEAMEMVEDVFEVMDDVMDEIEEVEGEAGGLGLGDYSDSDDNDDDDDQNASKAESSVGDVTNPVNDAVEQIDVVSSEDNQETSQQDVAADVEPPESSLRKCIGIAIIAARIVSKLVKKTQQHQGNDQQEEHPDKLEGKLEDCGTGGEALTGTNMPPTDNNYKQKSKVTRSQSGTEGITLQEAGIELRNEASELVEAVKQDGVRTAEIVKEGSLCASNLVQGSTKQALASTGALKVGHGLYREADFISGYLNKEGKAVAKSVEKETVEKTKQFKENKLVKATGVEKVGHGLYREADFIGGHLNKEGKAVAKSVEKETVEKTKQLKDNNLVKAIGVEKVGHGLYREADFIGGHLNKEAQKAFGFEEGKSGLKQSTEFKTIEDSEKGGRKPSTQIKEERRSRSAIQTVDRPSKNVPPTEAKRQERLSKAKINTVSKEAQGSSKKELLAHAGPSQNLSKELQIISETSDNKPVKGKTEGGKQTCESIDLFGDELGSNQDPECLTREPVPGVTLMTSNVMEGTSGAVGAAASQAKNLDEKTKQGLKQTQKKSKGLLQIAMRLVRLIMRVLNKRGSSASSSQNSSRRGSTSSGASNGPTKGKRAAEGGVVGDAADIAGAAASVAMGSAGSKGGKIGAIIGIVVRLIRMLSKLRGGQQEAPIPDMRASKDSIDLVSDSEFYDCGEEFPTSEIHTQTEDKLSLLSVATQTTQTDPGSTLKMTTRDSADITDMRIDESSDKESISFAHVFQADDNQNNDSPSNSQSTELNVIKQNTNSTKGEHSTSLTREQKGTNSERLKCDDGRDTTRRNSLQRITLKISSPNIEHSSGASNSDTNSIFLDIDAPVVLHSTREVRTSMNDDVNSVANDNTVGINSKQQLDFEGPSTTKPRYASKDEYSPPYDNLFRSSDDLNELEKQTQSRRSTRPRNSYRSISSDIDDTSKHTNLTRGTIVPYSSSSSEDLDQYTPFVSHRRTTVVRFEDECEQLHAYDEDEPITNYREQKKRNVLNRYKDKQNRATYSKKYESIEKERYSDVDDDLSMARETGYPYNESERLLHDFEKPTVQFSDLPAMRKSRLSGSRSSYFGDDESDHSGGLC